MHVCMYVCMYVRFWWEKLRQRGHFENQDLEGRILFKRIFKSWDVGHDVV